MRQSKAIVVLESWMNKIRKDSLKIHNEIHEGKSNAPVFEDPFQGLIIRKSCRMDTEYIKVYDKSGEYSYGYTEIKHINDSECITIEYDGDAFNWLSRESGHGAFFRNKLDEKMRENGFMIEDIFSWASTITEA